MRKPTAGKEQEVRHDGVTGPNLSFLLHGGLGPGPRLFPGQRWEQPLSDIIMS